MISVLMSYLIGGSLTFLIGTKLFFTNSNAALNADKSWQALLFFSVLWPITAPVSFVELRLKNHQPQDYFQNPSSPINPLPLGYLLKKAGLISESQVIQALEVQQIADKHIRIGEIIASQGWLKQETIDFFAESLPQILSQPKQPIGQYLKSAQLLDDLQIEEILDEQPERKLRFGEIAVLKGWVKPETVNFVLRYLQRKLSDSSKIQSKVNQL